MWVVRLTGAYAAVAVRGSAAVRVSPCGGVVARTIVGGAVWTIRRAARTVVAAVPGTVSVVGTTAIHDRSATVPATVPAAIAPAISAAHHRADRDTDSERKHCSRWGWGNIDIAGVHVGIAVNDRGVVHGYVHHLWIRRLNHDGLRRLLHYNKL